MRAQGPGKYGAKGEDGRTGALSNRVPNVVGKKLVIAGGEEEMRERLGRKGKGLTPRRRSGLHRSWDDKSPTGRPARHRQSRAQEAEDHGGGAPTERASWTSQTTTGPEEGSTLPEPCEKERKNG